MNADAQAKRATDSRDAGERWRSANGTVLAWMAVRAGVPAEGAVARVRERYSPHAVETAAQEAWVLRFAGRAAP